MFLPEFPTNPCCVLSLCCSTIPTFVPTHSTLPPAMTTCSDPTMVGPVAMVNKMRGMLGCHQCLHRESAAYRRRVFDLPWVSMFHLEFPTSLCFVLFPHCSTVPTFVPNHSTLPPAMTTCSDPTMVGPVAMVNNMCGVLGCHQCLHCESAAYRRRVFDPPLLSVFLLKFPTSPHCVLFWHCSIYSRWCRFSHLNNT